MAPGDILGEEEWEEFVNGFEESGFEFYEKWERVEIAEAEGRNATESHRLRDKFYGCYEEIKDLFWTSPEHAGEITDAMESLSVSLSRDFGKRGLIDFNNEIPPLNSQDESSISEIPHIREEVNHEVSGLTEVQASECRSLDASEIPTSWRLLSLTEIHLLEVNTRCNTEAWSQARLFKITASRIHSFYRNKNDLALYKLLSSISKPASQAATYDWSEWGHHVERCIFSGSARTWAAKNGFLLGKSGLFILQSNQRIAATPDGTFYKEGQRCGVLEVKGIGWKRLYLLLLVAEK